MVSNRERIERLEKRLEDVVEGADRDRNQYETDREEWRAERTKLLLKVDVANKALEGSQAESNRMHQELEMLRSRSGKRDVSLANIAKDNAASEEVIRIQGEDLDKSIADFSNLEAEKNRLVEQLEIVRSTVDELRDTIEHYEARLDERTTMEEELDAAKVAINELALEADLQQALMEDQNETLNDLRAFKDQHFGLTNDQSSAAPQSLDAELDAAIDHNVSRRSGHSHAFSAGSDITVDDDSQSITPPNDVESVHPDSVGSGTHPATPNVVDAGTSSACPGCPDCPEAGPSSMSQAVDTGPSPACSDCPEDVPSGFSRAVKDAIMRAFDIEFDESCDPPYSMVTSSPTNCDQVFDAGTSTSERRAIGAITPRIQVDAGTQTAPAAPCHRMHLKWVPFLIWLVTMLLYLYSSATSERERLRWTAANEITRVAVVSARRGRSIVAPSPTLWMANAHHAPTIETHWQAPFVRFFVAVMDGLYFVLVRLWMALFDCFGGARTGSGAYGYGSWLFGVFPVGWDGGSGPVSQFMARSFASTVGWIETSIGVSRARYY